MVAIITFEREKKGGQGVVNVRRLGLVSVEGRTCDDREPRGDCDGCEYVAPVPSDQHEVVLWEVAFGRKRDGQSDSGD
jgi:hypothetical protein